jgi:hypothetical protein
MLRLILWATFALYLILVALVPAAAAPIGLLGAGAAVVVGKIPGVVLLGIAAVAYLRHRPNGRAA